METKIQIKSIFGEVKFEYECENNSIKKTVEQAVKNRINLSYSDLRYSDLRGSDLRNSNLSYSDLRYSDLRGSDLSGSDLRGSYLRGSDLSYSDLRYSNLRGSDLRNSNLRGSENTESAYLPIFCKWEHSIIGNNIQIGCKTKSISDWEEFFNSDKEFETKRGTDEFKQIQAVFESYKAYINFLNK